MFSSGTRAARGLARNRRLALPVATPRTPVFRLRLLVAALHGVLALAAPALAQTVAPAPARAGDALAGNTSSGTLPEVEVAAQRLRQEAGAAVIINAEQIEQTGATDISDVVRYQPLVDAPGVLQGATRGASRWDRGGTTGYNIRGVEGNRVGLDVDGIEMPDAVSRAPLTNRAQDATFGMGRDFIDPDIYSFVEIQSGTTNSQRTAGGIGGAVSFRSKSPDEYVNPARPYYVGGKLGYTQANDTWTKGLTAAGLSGDFSAILAYVRRDGHATRTYGDGVAAFPQDWHSDALLLKGQLQLSSEHKLELAADLYQRSNTSAFDNWNSAGTAVNGRSVQDAQTGRDTLSLAHIWTPVNGAVDRLETRIYSQKTHMDDMTDTLLFTNRSLLKDVSRNNTEQIGLVSAGNKRIANHGLRFGVNYSRNRNEHPFYTSEAYGARQPFPDTQTVRAGAFFEDTIDFDAGGHRLALVPGVRMDRVKPEIRNTASFDQPRITQAQLVTMYGNAPSTTIWSPSLALTYDLTPRLTSYVQWKRSGRAPTNSEIFGYWNGGGGTYALLGDKNLKKETSNAFDVGLKGTLTDGVTFNGSVFQTKYKDFISYTRYTRANNPEKFVNIQSNLNILYQATNQAEATIYGTEMSARVEHGTWQPAVRGLYSTWALGWSKGHSRTNFAGDRDVDLDTVQPAKAIVGVGYDAPEKAWGLNLTGVFVRGKQAVATNRLGFSNDPNATLAASTTQLFSVPGFARFDLSGYWRLSPNVRLNAGIYNLSDKKYWAYSNVRSLQPQAVQDRVQIAHSTAPGRTYALNLSVDF